MAGRKSSTAAVDARTAIEEFQDFLAPQLDVYEQAVYLYVLRHSRLVGKPRMTVELKSAPQHIAKGLGRKGSRLAPGTCLQKLRSLQAKGCIRLVDAGEDAPDVRCLLPSEVPGIVKGKRRRSVELEKLDFVNVPEHRRRIFEREEGRCFYCKRRISATSGSVTNVHPRPAGDNSYRNVVAACRRCSSRKGESSGEDLLRVLYREGYVSADVLAGGLEALKRLREGQLKP